MCEDQAWKHKQEGVGQVALSMQEKEEEDAHCGINKGSILFLKGLAVK